MFTRRVTIALAFGAGGFFLVYFVVLGGGATAGTVAFGAVLDAVRESRLDELLGPHRLDAAQSAVVDRLVLADEDATAVAGRDLGGGVVGAVTDAFASGYRAGFWVCCGAFALAGRSPRSSHR